MGDFNILALEFSTETGSVALIDRDGTVVDRSDLESAPSARIYGLIDALLASTAMTLERLDGVALGIGPGAFTGLRLACGVAQGLALGLSIPLYPVGSLRALVEGVAGERWVAIQDARMGQVYLAAYEKRGERVLTAIEPMLCTLDELPELPDGVWGGIGPGAGLHGAVLQSRWGERWGGVVDSGPPQAAAVARVAVSVEGRAVHDPAQVMPFYLRDKVALTRAERGL